MSTRLAACGRGLRARAAAALVSLVAATACRDDVARETPPVPGGDASRGQRTVVAYGCGGCHVIPGVPGARGRVGPPLTDFSQRRYVAGRLPNSPDELVRWIRDPQGVAPGTAMPGLGVSERDARDISAYLYTLGRGELGPPHLIPPGLLPSQ